jgi:hypothetical protein
VGGAPLHDGVVEDESDVSLGVPQKTEHRTSKGDVLYPEELEPTVVVRRVIARR